MLCVCIQARKSFGKHSQNNNLATYTFYNTKPIETHNTYTCITQTVYTPYTCHTHAIHISLTYFVCRLENNSENKKLATTRLAQALQEYFPTHPTVVVNTCLRVYVHIHRISIFMYRYMYLGVCVYLHSYVYT